MPTTRRPDELLETLKETNRLLLWLATNGLPPHPPAQGFTWYVTSEGHWLMSPSQPTQPIQEL